MGRKDTPALPHSYPLPVAVDLDPTVLITGGFLGPYEAPELRINCSWSEMPARSVVLIVFVFFIRNDATGMATECVPPCSIRRQSESPPNHAAELSRRIPRVVFQTWISKVLPIGFQIVQSRMLRRNPDYRIDLFDDEDVDAFVSVHFNGTDVERAFRKLSVGAARADLWRYLVLFRNGGIYLDLDSEIVVSLDRELIRPDDGAVVSREPNRHFMCQYFLVFEAGHPILARVIQLATKAILEGGSDSESQPHWQASRSGGTITPIPLPVQPSEKGGSGFNLKLRPTGRRNATRDSIFSTTSSIDPWLLDPLLFLAGPPVFNQAVDEVARAAAMTQRLAGESSAQRGRGTLSENAPWTNVWSASDTDINAIFDTAGIRARILGTDFAGAVVFKHEYSNQMGWFKPHWRDASKGVFSLALPRLLLLAGTTSALVTCVLLATTCGRSKLAATLVSGKHKPHISRAVIFMCVLVSLCWAVLRGYIKVIY